MCAQSAKALSIEAERVSNLLKVIFGSRKSDGFRRACRKRALEEVLNHPAGFQTDIGSRYGVRFNNGRCIVLYESEVLSVISGPDANHANHKALTSVMTNKPLWTRIRLELSVMVIVWVAVTGPFHTIVSKNVTYGEVKRCFTVAFATINAIKYADCSFTRAMSTAESMPHNNDSMTPESLAQINYHWQEASVTMKKVINKTLVEAVDKCYKKLETDWEVMSNLPIPLNTRLPWDNR